MKNKYPDNFKFVNSMKSLLIIIAVCFFSKNNLQAQDCDSLIGYTNDDQYSIYIIKLLQGKVLNNPTDSMHGMFLKTNYFKTPNSKGIRMIFYFVRCGKMMDASVKVKIEFMDGATIILSRSKYDTDNPAVLGMFFYFVGGDYGNNYDLTLLRTKSISKISISGNQIDSYTYLTDFSKSLDYMFGMECLSNLLK
jgi:hypothetical protein